MRRPADRGEAMTDEEAQIRERDRHYRKSPGVAVCAPDDRRALLRLLNEARRERDEARQDNNALKELIKLISGEVLKLPPDVVK
jgi:hypothetical protein